MADTDSLVYVIKTDDVYKDLWKYNQEFDYLSYPKDSKYFDQSNKSSW